MIMPVQRTTLAVTWDELHRQTRLLSHILLQLDPFQGIIAVTRGGLVPAAIIARELGIRLVETLCIASYDEDCQQALRIVKEVAGDGEGMVVIDDLVDTGVTARAIRERLPRAHFAVIYAKPQGLPWVDSFVTSVDQDSWIVFPWDAPPRLGPGVSPDQTGARSVEEKSA